MQLNGNLFGSKKQMTSHHKCIIDWSNYYSNVITMLWPRSGGIQYPCFLDKSNKLPMPHVFLLSILFSRGRALGGGRENKGLYENAFCKRCSIAAFPGRNMSCEISNVQTYKCGNFKDYHLQTWNLSNFQSQNFTQVNA